MAMNQSLITKFNYNILNAYSFVSKHHSFMLFYIKFKIIELHFLDLNTYNRI